MIELVIRLVFSLAVVIGLLLLLAKFSAHRIRGSAGSVVRVVHRQPLSRTSAVAVVTVGSRILVLGTTEQQVQLLTELDPDELDEPLSLPVGGFPELHTPSEELAPRQPVTPSQPLEPVEPVEPSQPAPVVRDLELVSRHPAVANGPGSVAAATEGALAGSVLSAQTWKQALAAAEATRLRLSGKDRDAS